MAATVPALPGDIVQITEQSDKWFRALLVVGEVKAWGVLASALIPHNDGKPVGDAYCRLTNGRFEVVGRVVVLTEEMLAARRAAIATADTVLREAGGLPVPDVIAVVRDMKSWAPELRSRVIELLEARA